MLHFFPKSALLNSRCGLSTDAAYVYSTYYLIVHIIIYIIFCSIYLNSTPPTLAICGVQSYYTVLCKSNAKVFRRNSRLFLAFRRKNIEFSMEANFQRKVTIIRKAYCFQLREFSNENSLGTKIDFEFCAKNRSVR